MGAVMPLPFFKGSFMQISVCLILKNEGTTIYRCLQSMRQFVDQWIIGIDDKTTDNTEQEITRFFTDNPIKDKHIYKYTWQDNFSKARNEGMDKAIGDYILIMDGHEYFPESWYNITEGRELPVLEILQHIKKKLAEELKENKKYDEIFFHLYQQPFIGNIPNNYFMQPRIYRNDPALRFNRASHNTITNNKVEASIHYPEVILIHDAPENNRKERTEQRLALNVPNLLSDLAKNPKDTRAMFYLGNTYMEGKQWEKAIEQYLSYEQNRTDDNSEKYQCLIHCALCYRELKNSNEMKMVLHRAIKIDPMRRDAFCILGDLYFDEKDYERALFYFNTALSIKPQPSRMFNNANIYTWQPHQQMARAYAGKGNIPSAIAHLKYAYNYLPNEQWIKQINEWAGEKKNVYIVDRIGSFTNEFKKYLEGNGYNVIRTKEYDNTLGLWADYIWQEWADSNAILSSKSGKTVIRVHGYEAYLNRELFSKIDFKNARVVFVAKHIQNMMMQWVNGNGAVISNGVDCEKFYIKNDKRDGKQVGITGYMNDKKNPFLLLQIIKANPDYVFNLRIDWQSPFWEETFKHELADAKNVVYHGWYNDLNEFWNNMNFVLSTSIIESFSYNVAEAMAAGCKPYIYNWKGAQDIWHKDYIFEQMPKFEKVEDRKIYRDYILSNYNLKNVLPEMERVLVGKQ